MCSWYLTRPQTPVWSYSQHSGVMCAELLFSPLIGAVRLTLSARSMESENCQLHHCEAKNVNFNHEHCT
jgi:hypothetical protein